MSLTWTSSSQLMCSQLKSKLFKKTASNLVTYHTHVNCVQLNMPVNMPYNLMDIYVHEYFALRFSPKEMLHGDAILEINCKV